MDTPIIRRSYAEADAPEACPHCSHGYVLEEVETSLGDFETVNYFCLSCCGTGRKMTRSQRETHRKMLRQSAQERFLVGNGDSSEPEDDGFPPRTSTCLVCGKVRTYPPGRRLTPTCGRECGVIYRKQRLKPTPIPETKLCKRCGIVKPLTAEHFPPGGGRNLGGFYPYCRECNREKRRNWAKRNPEKEKASRRASYLNSRARKRGVKGLVSGAVFEQLYAEQRGKCAYCRKTLEGYHIDHIIPVSKGGTDEADNLCLACPDCNLSKNASTIEEWRERCPSRFWTD